MKKKYKGLLIAVSVIGFTLTAILILFLLPDFQAKQTTKAIHIELGSRAATDPSDYISCSSWSMPFTIIDTSNVNTKEIGTYQITLYHGFQKMLYQAVVEDTTPPEFKTDLRATTIKKGKSINLNSLGIEVTDRSNITSFQITEISSDRINLDHNSGTDTLLESTFREGIKLNAEHYQFEYGGVYQLTISATDEANNTSLYTIRVTVEEPPVIETASAYYVAVNETIDFSRYISSWDFLDEDYSVEDVKIDTSQVMFSKSGEYPVTFTGTDDYGLSTTLQSVVYVASADHLQELINSHAISVENDIVIGAHNLYDNGYFTDKSAEFIQQAVRPSLVHIYNDKKELYGSGYIIDISDEFVTIATNEHVAKGCMNPEIYFCDTSRRFGSLVAADPRNDIAFIRIPISDSGSETSLTPDFVKNTLRTVHIDKGYWDNLANDANITVCYNCIDETGSSWHAATGTMVEKLCTRNWNQYLDINECIIDSEPIAGSSGSAIFDECGRFIGMMRGYTNYSGYIETVVVPLSEILDYYEKIFTEKVQYQ